MLERGTAELIPELPSVLGLSLPLQSSLVPGVRDRVLGGQSTPVTLQLFGMTKSLNVLDIRARR